MKPGCGNGTVMIVLRRNHSVPRASASWFTAVGASRVSIGPPISVIVARRERIAVLREQRDGREHRHRRLADRHHMRVRTEVMQDLDQVVDVVVEVEMSPPKTGTIRASAQSVMKTSCAGSIASTVPRSSVA